MAQPFLPVGLTPLNGKSIRYEEVQLLPANVVIYPGDVIQATTTGADKLVSDTDTEQINLLGVAQAYKVASGSGRLLIARFVPGALFKVMWATTGDNFTITTDWGSSYSLIANVAPSTVRKRSTQYLDGTIDNTNGNFIVRDLAGGPTNELTATVYPNFIVEIARDCIAPAAAGI